MRISVGREDLEGRVCIYKSRKETGYMQVTGYNRWLVFLAREIRVKGRGEWTGDYLLGLTCTALVVSGIIELEETER